MSHANQSNLDLDHVESQDQNSEPTSNTVPLRVMSLDETPTPSKVTQVQPSNSSNISSKFIFGVIGALILLTLIIIGIAFFVTTSDL